MKLSANCITKRFFTSYQRTCLLYKIFISGISSGTFEMIGQFFFISE
ncbi:unnamed protein product [Brassica rapa subsp. trilocularis]